MSKRQVDADEALAMDRAKLADRIHNPRKYGITCCILCQGPLAFVGAWIVDKKLTSRLRIPDGKQRFIFYGSCEACRGQIEKVEQKILATYQ